NYGSDRMRDMAGLVERVGDNRWRLVLPAPAYESLLDVIELVPAGWRENRQDTNRGKMMRILWTGAAALALAAPAAAQTLRGEVETQMPSLMAIYKDLHAHPELSFMEVRSAGILAAEARKLGFKVTEKVGGTGIVAVMENRSEE